MITGENVVIMSDFEVILILLASLILGGIIFVFMLIGKKMEDKDSQDK